MNLPKELNLNTNLKNLIEKGEVRVLVLDGNTDKAYLAETPMYGVTEVQTNNGYLSRVHYNYGYKFK
ncbi:XtrA/YqaO family protein [Bacillus atrophaeus]|uniref:XtrA/YqaO family protein n=1 Tax=Bacillus atrophaeus TaxID=1452 RepID=UPI0028F6FF17|nr:XtrA/YqaO family protein [Bacillus atrophaeus]WNV80949.1 XtrA/YqaO family protein [Bacillus atrophaeus]